MKAKKWLIIITMIISFVSVVCAYWYCNVMRDDFFMNCSFAIMGSAILSGIMSLTEYFVTRKQCLEQYYLAAYTILKQIEKAKYFFADEPIELLEQYFLEKQNNESRSVFGMDISTTAKDSLLTYMTDRWKQTVDIPEPEFTAYAEDQFNNRMAQYFEDACKTMDSYVRIAEIDLSPLENAYGNLDFLFANSSMRKKIYEQIHLRLRDYKHNVAEQVFHFKLFLSGESENFAVLMGKIDELQQMYFSRNEKCEGDFCIITIYGKYADSMDESIEKLRCKIYGQKYMKPQHFPVAAYQIRRKVDFPEIKKE